MNDTFESWVPSAGESVKKEKLDHIDPSFRNDASEYASNNHDDFNATVAAAAVAAVAATDAEHHMHHSFHLDDSSSGTHGSLAMDQANKEAGTIAAEAAAQLAASLQSGPKRLKQRGNGSGGSGSGGTTTEKRAAQNRNAQRSFRIRKEQQIRELRERAEQTKQLQATIDELRRENLHLRDYTLALQSKLMEHEEGVPTPPSLVFDRSKEEAFGFLPKKK